MGEAEASQSITDMYTIFLMTWLLSINWAWVILHPALPLERIVNKASKMLSFNFIRPGIRPHTLTQLI